MSGKQIKLFKDYSPNEIQSYINQINSVTAATNGVFDVTAVQGYANAIQGLEAKQAALLLSTQGLTNAQIAETLAVNGAASAENYQAMAEAGLLARKQELTVAEVQENLQTVLGTEADIGEAMAVLGLSAAIEGQEHQIAKLTAKKLQEAVTTGVLTEAQAQELAMRTGVMLSMQAQSAGVLPKWIATLKAATLAVWDQVKATITWMATNPVGWITAAVAAIGALIFGLVKLYDAIDVTLEEQREKLQEAKDAYEDVKNELQELETELQNTKDAIKELEDTPNLSWVEQEELNRLREVTKELELQKQLKQEEKVKAAEELYRENKNTFDTEFSGSYGPDVTVPELKQKLSAGEITLGTLDLEGNITDMTATLQYLEEARETLTDTDEIADYDSYIEMVTENMSKYIEENGADCLTSLSEYKQNLLEIAGTRDLTEDEQAFYDYLTSMQKAVYEFYSPATWNTIEFDSIFRVEGLEKTKEELIAMYKAGELSPETLESFPKLNEAIQESEIIAGEGSNVFKEVFNEIAALADKSEDTAEETVNSFDLSTYKEQVDNVQSSISTLRSALDSLNSGGLDKIEVIDLMQEFPALVPYIDLTADGFGHLSEGLSALIEQQPDSLIQSLQEMKGSLDSEEERKQIDLLIDSLQRLSSYGDTDVEAYAAAIGNTWNDTANVIEGVTTQFENLAKVQEVVADGLTMSATAAAELAKMYPEILTKATVTADGQITLNEDVVNSILDGDSSIIDAQIAKLEADKAELEAKRSSAEAQLNIAKQVGEGEAVITKEAVKDMSKKMDAYNNVVATVAEDIAENMANAAFYFAESMHESSIAAQNSATNVQKKMHSLAQSVKGAAVGIVTGNLGIYDTDDGGRKKESLKAKTRTGDSSKEFQSQLELDIKGYTDAISNIDAQIEVLKNLQSTFENNGGIGGHGYADKIKELENEKDRIRNALKEDAGSSKSEFEELFDFFERRVEVLDNALSLLKANLENVTGSFGKNNIIDAEIGITEEKFNNYTDALAMYTQKAEEALSKLPSDIAEKVKNGAVALTDFIGDENEAVVDAIKEYEDWADKVADCNQELAELKESIRQLELEKFNNIMEDFTNQFDLREDGKDLISKKIALLEEAGQLIGESFFTAQIEQSKKQLELLEAEKAQLVNQMSNAIATGRVNLLPSSTVM